MTNHLAVSVPPLPRKTLKADPLEVLQEVSRLIHSELQLDVVLERTLEAALSAVGARRGFLMLSQPDGTLEVAAARNISAEALRNGDLAYSRRAVAEAQRTLQPFVTNDAMALPVAVTSDSIRQQGLRAICCVPMRRGPRVVGFIYVDDTSARHFQPEDVRLLELVGDLATTAMDRAALFRELCHRERLAAVGTVVAGVVHDLAGPLTNIMIYAQLLPRSPEDDAPDVIASEARRCHTMVRSLTSLARRQSIQPTPVDLVGLVREVLQVRAPFLRGQGIRLVEELPAGLPSVRGEPELLRQVVFNLLTNAEQAMAEAPRRQLTVEGRVLPEDGLVELGIRDSGPGIPEAARPHLFEPFFTTKPAGEGTGLGLSICAAVLRDHGGSITADNHAEGGAVFRIRIPLAGDKTP